MAESEAIVPANELSFEILCALLEDLYGYAHKSKRDEQDKRLFQFINDLRMHFSNITEKKNCTFFPILRLLLPNQERERSAYNLKESKLSQLLVKVLSLHKNSDDAKKLLNFRSASNNNQGTDFPSVAYYVLKNRVDGRGNLTIKQINNALDKISNAEVGKKGVILDEVFSNIIMNTTPLQQKWFLRIILKDLKISMSPNRILSIFHPDAPEFYEMCNSVYKVCEEFDDTNTSSFGVKIFSAVSPMLSERLDVTHFAKLNQNATYIIENKFDGERFQLHMNEGTFEYFSRKGFSYSEKYGKTYNSSGLLTPFLRNCFIPEARNFILDGEMMGWHKDRHCFGSKGMSYDVKKITENSKYKPCFCVFDLLYYNDKSLIGSDDKGGISLKNRLKLLDNLFKDIPGVIYHSKREMVQSSTNIVMALNKANESGEEGIVVKDLNSYYIANKRNSGWYKIKPEYTEGTMEDLDLVIIGGDYAENKRQGLVNSFLVALVDKLSSVDAPRRWLCMGRVSTGLSYDERERLCDLLEPHWKKFGKIQIPDCIVWNKVKPELWVNPENSIVLQVRATELIRSKDFATDYTLRFPRVLKIRDDKPVQDILTLDEFNDLIKAKAAVIKLSTGSVNPMDVDAMSMEAAPRRKRKLKAIEVAEQFKAVVTPNEGLKDTESQSLKDKKICVLSDEEDCKKHELENIIRSHGGIVVQNKGSDTWCCVAGRKNLRVQNALAMLNCDIVKTDWIRNLPKSNSPCPLPLPLEMLAIIKKTQTSLARHYDKYGDSYTEFVNGDILRKCFDKMNDSNECKLYLTIQEMMKLDEELFGEHNPFSFLRGCFLHFIDVNDRLGIRARMYGAEISDITLPNLTHVITSDINRNSTISVSNSQIYIVSDDWLQTSLREKRRVSESDFLIQN